MIRCYIVLICLIFFSCKKEEKIPANLVDRFINRDVSGDYEFYFDQLSQNYKELLYLKYQTKDDQVIFDSLKDVMDDLHFRIADGDFIMKNVVTENILTEIEGLSLIKYRSNLFDVKNQSELYKDIVLLKMTDSVSTKFMPYSYYYTKNIDSLILEVYNVRILNNVKETLEFKNFKTSIPELKKIEKEFNNYIYRFKKGDTSLLDVIYPPIIDEILKQSGISSLTEELKKEIVNEVGFSFIIKYSDLYMFIVEDIIQLDCDDSQSKYLLTYAIKFNEDLYIPGQVIVFIENSKIYFVEYEKTDFEGTVSGIFESSFMDCIAKQSKFTRERLGIK